LFLFNRDKKNLTKYLNRIRYMKFKEKLKDEINILEHAWCKSSLNEKGKWLYLNLPEPHKISNGQRDVTLLCGAFNKILYSSKQKNLIVIIDEIFDYLDDYVEKKMDYLNYYLSEFNNNFSIKIKYFQRNLFCVRFISGEKKASLPARFFLIV